MPEAILAELQRHYRGFYIESAQGNNALSYEERDNRRIFVPPLKCGTPADLHVGKEIVFSEVDEGVEHNLTGLREMIFWQRQRHPVFIFDNHNHAFCFWVAGFLAGAFPAGSLLVHVDQHSDMWEPPQYPADLVSLTLSNAFKYSNFSLNVGNFIQPALKLGLFSGVEIIEGAYTLKKSYARPIVLDIDVDFFAEEMDYIDRELKIEKIREYLAIAQFVTIATSPYFIPQDRAIAVIREIFEE